MKKHFFLAGIAALLAVPAFAQTEKTVMKNEATGAKTTTEVKVRDNGTVKTETETRTGRTKAGEVVNEAAQDPKMAGKKVADGTEKVVEGTGNVAKKAATGTKKVAKKAVKGTKKVAKKTGATVKKGAQKTEAAVEKAVD